MVTISVRHGRPSIVHTEAETAAPTATPRSSNGWLGWSLIVGGLAMIPWLFVLAVQLPSSARAAHWSTAWVGLDTLEALGLVTTGVLVRLGDERRCLAAAATAALLPADAWFDVTTAAAGSDQTTAILMAVFLELPIAALCAVLSIRTFPRRESSFHELRFAPTNPDFHSVPHTHPEIGQRAATASEDTCFTTMVHPATRPAPDARARPRRGRRSPPARP
jgi:hypothetical protein